MASTAAGVAVGHTVGNGLSNMLFGGRHGDEPIPAAPVEQSPEQRELGGACAMQVKGAYRWLSHLPCVCLPSAGALRCHPAPETLSISSARI